jgi:hypothetical protein
MSKLLKDYDYDKFEFNEIQEHIDAALSDCKWAKDDYNKIQIKSWEDVPGWINDAQWIFKEVVDNCKDGDKVVELGTYFGQSACYMGQLIRDSGKDIKFDTFDTFEQLEPSMRAGMQPKAIVDYRFHKGRDTAPMSIIVKSHFEACGVDDYVNLIICDALYSHHLYEDNSLMMFYNDGINEQNALYKLMSNFWPKIKKGGLMAGDDINFDDVKSAVNKFCKENNLKYEHTLLSWVIRK